MMKKRLCLNLSVICILLCNAQESQQIPPIYVTVNTTQANQTSSNSYATAVSYAFCKQWVASYVQTAQEIGKTIWHTIQDHLWQHKLRYTLYSLVGGYAVLIVYIYHIDHFMNNQQCWHNWTDNVSIDAFYAMDHSALAQRLHNAIQKRYFDQRNPTNKIAPLICFFVDIKEEKKSIERYCCIIDWLETFKMGMLPCVHLPNREKLVQAKRHVLFLEQIATAWCLEYN